MFVMIAVASYSSNQLGKGHQVLSDNILGFCAKRHLDNLDEGHMVAMGFAIFGAVVALVLLILGVMYRDDGWKKITGTGEHIVWTAMILISVLSSIFLYRYNRGLMDITLVAPIKMEDLLKDNIGYAQGTLASIIITAFPIVGILWVCVGIVAAVMSESIKKAFGGTAASMGRFM